MASLSARISFSALSRAATIASWSVNSSTTSGATPSSLFEEGTTAIAARSPSQGSMSAS